MDLVHPVLLDASEVLAEVLPGRVQGLGFRVTAGHGSEGYRGCIYKSI